VHGNPLPGPAKGIRVYAIKGNWQLNNSIQSKIVAMAFAMAAEIERDLISQRTTEALAARKQQRMPLGRPKGVGKSKLDIYHVDPCGNHSTPAKWRNQDLDRQEIRDHSSQLESLDETTRDNVSLA
jgi:Resolvase, N terminal domain